MNNTPETINNQQSKSVAWPRWKGALYGAVGFPLVHGAVPWALSLLTRRYGWSQHRPLPGSRPGGWNLLGLILVAAGSVYAIWALVLHSIQGWQWERTQAYFLQSGPYRFSRNPMYVGELALWLGWATFYGSISVLLGWGLWWATFVFYIVPSEERAIEAQFGEAYLSYKKRVPRWFGRARG
jgi:Phospholipid methyltransferase